jgi:hypothetical protein
MKTIQCLLIATVLMAGVLTGGCAAVQRGTTQLKFEPKTPEDRVLTAMQDGKYALYAGSDVKPQFMVDLKRGDKLGFQRQGENVLAIAGQEKFTLPGGATYYWNYRGK